MFMTGKLMAAMYQIGLASNVSMSGTSTLQKQKPVMEMATPGTKLLMILREGANIIIEARTL